MTSKVKVVIGLLALPLALGCDCGSKTVTKDFATVAKDYVGPDPTPPAASAYTGTPAGSTAGQAEIPVDFGVVNLGTRATRYLFLKNTGNITLNVVGVEWQSGSSQAFSVACLDGGDFKVGCPYSDQSYLQVISGSDLVVQINYAPPAVAADSGTFIIHSNAHDYPTVLVDLSGQGSTAKIQACISDCTGDQGSSACWGAAELCNDAAPNLTVLFGDIDSGGTVKRNVVVKNLGELDLVVGGLTISGGDTGQFQIESGSGLPGTITAGGSATVVVDFKPVYGGDNASDLEISSNDNASKMVTVHLRGRALAPHVCPDPLALDFGTVAVGDTKDMVFTLKNCGLRDLSLINLVFAAQTSSDFSPSNWPTVPQTLAAGASVDVHVVYTPSDRGSDTGGVEIYSDDPSSDPQTHYSGVISLRGNGIIRECDLLATPAAVDFGGTVQNTPDNENLVLSNQGTADCRIDHVAITQNSADNEFSIITAPPDGTIIHPGDMMQAQLQYLPINLGVDTGVLTITGNDKNGPQKNVNLHGEGVATAECSVQVSPTGILQFGTVKVGVTLPRVVTLKNVGNAICHFNAPNLSHTVMPGFASDFTITRGPTAPFVLAKKGQAGDSQEIEVTFAPLTVNVDGGTLSFHTDDDPNILTPSAMCFMPGGFPPNPPAAGDGCLTLYGMSAESDIEVVPTQVDFGVVTVGCNSPETRVTVYNLGSAALNITNIYLEDPNDGNFEIRSAPACPYTLNGGSHFDVKVRYHPQNTNAHRNTLFIDSDASNVKTLAVPLFGKGTNDSSQTDIFHQPSQVKSDVLFVVDDSGSMQWVQDELVQHFSAFFNWAITLDVDYHIGVIGVYPDDVSSQVGSPPRDVIPGVLVEVPNVTPKIITNLTPDPNGTFAKNVNLGTCCADPRESGLESAWMALSPPLVDDPAKNGGFLREDAKLYIICASDEQDQSKGEPDFYVDFFLSLKGARNTGMMKFSAICGDAPNGCGPDPQNPTAESGSRYIEVANRTGGLFISICDSDWEHTLQSLGIDAFTAIREFPLSRTADPSTITVTVNGAPVSQAGTPGGANGWTYYPDDNGIYFGDNVVPGKGDTITVSYTAACL